MKFIDVEKDYLKDLYLRHKGNIFEMVKESGLSRATIYRKLELYFGEFRLQIKETKWKKY